MRLLIKQRIFSWGDTYDIYDESGEAKYFVKGKVFSLGHQIHVFNKQTDEEVGAIKQKLLTLLPKFEITIGGRLVGSISREFTFLKPKYRVEKVLPLSQTHIVQTTRYRARSLPINGALLREEDRGEEQMSIL